MPNPGCGSISTLTHSPNGCISQGLAQAEAKSLDSSGILHVGSGAQAAFLGLSRELDQKQGKLGPELALQGERPVASGGSACGTTAPALPSQVLVLVASASAAMS